MIDWKEKASNIWMKFSRGSTHDRFEKIRDAYLDVSKRTKEQIDREDTIIDAYMDFRFALKEGEIASQELLKIQEGRLNESKKLFLEAVDIVKNYKGNDQADASRLQLTRDEAERKFNEEDKVYQLIKDVADNLTVGYNVGETLVGKLKQTHDLKDRVYRRAVTFFDTNEHVFTTMDAIYTSQHGLHEQTQGLEAMKEGIEKGIEDIASLGNELEKAALKAGYGATIDKDFVQKLVDSVVSFQEDSYRMIDELRIEATANAKEIVRIVDEGKQRTGKALENYLSQKV